MNDAVVDPCETVTDAGTVATDVFELESATTAPPFPAGDERVIKPDAVCPPTSTAGLAEIPVRTTGAGSMVKPKPSLEFRYEAVRVTAVGLVTESGVTVKIPELEPAGITTVAGRVTSVGDAVNEMDAPPVRASADSSRLQAAVAG